MPHDTNLIMLRVFDQKRPLSFHVERQSHVAKEQTLPQPNGEPFRQRRSKRPTESRELNCDFDEDLDDSGAGIEFGVQKRPEGNGFRIIETLGQQLKNDDLVST